MKAKRSPKLTCVDLFAGAGGLSQGLGDAGFETLYANEVVPQYAETYSLNHAGTLVDARDIRTVDPRAVREQLGIGRGDLALVAGGPPCQGFSINAPLRSDMDHRNHLFRDFLRFVEEFLPEAVLIENVPGLVSFSGGATLEAILASLEQLGYAADVRILYAPHYGVPQMRWRTIVIGLRDGGEPLAAFPEPAHNAPTRVNFTSTFGGRSLVKLPTTHNLRVHTTVHDAIDDLAVLANGESGDTAKPYRCPPMNTYQAELRGQLDLVENHQAPRLSPINMRRMRHIPPGGNWTDIPRDLLPEGMKKARTSDHTKRYGRADPDQLSSTILTKCDPHWGAYFHYNQDRIFTVREAARIQSFPDRFVFTGSRVAQYEQVGNAVPPMLGSALGLAIATVIGKGRSVAQVAR